MATLLSLGFISCKGSDDNEKAAEEAVAAALDGTWHIKLVTWYDFKDGKMDLSKPHSSHDWDRANTWDFKKEGSSYVVYENGKPSKFKEVSKNTFDNGYDRLIIKTISAKEMTAEFYNDYYQVEGVPDSAIIIFER